MCGNNVQNAGEECDGPDKPTCDDLGFDYGTTTCNGSCHLNSSSCMYFDGEVGGCFQIEGSC